MHQRVAMEPQGLVRVTYHIKQDGCWTPVDNIEPYVTRSARRHMMRARLSSFIQEIRRTNLVVQQGRSYAARLLTQGFDRHIAALQLGNCVKSLNPPSLLDTGVVAEIETLAGTPQATFAIDPLTEVFVPAQARRYPINIAIPFGDAASVTISSGVTTMTCATVDFTTFGIQFGDQVVFNTPTSVPVALSVRRVLSPTQLELHNPYGYTTAATPFRIESSGSQVLFSKLITASNHFPAATYGPAVLVHEAAWLFNDGACWNRVLFSAQDDSQGVLIQPADAFGVEVGAQFELTVIF